MDENQEKKETTEQVKEQVKEEKVKKEPAKKEDKVELKKQLETLKQEAEEFKDKWMRSVAEFDNYKKRNAKVWQDAFSEGVSSVIVKILPVGDSLDRALSMELDEKTKEGVKGIKKKFDETLALLGIEEINPVGETFDPNFSEAVMQAEKGEGEQSDTVKQVFEKGYKLKDKVIRYAKVSVIK